MKNFQTRLTVISVMAVFQLSVTTHAQQIEEIRVVADPLGDVDTHFIQPTQILDKNQLKSRSIQNIGEAVSRELGVTSSDFGAGSGRPVIRGLSGGRIKIMENNIGTMDASTISADHGVSTEPVFAEQIEILRGPATLLYGSGASGGLVNVVNHRIPERMPDGLEGNAIIQYETVNKGRTGAASVNAGDSNLAMHLSGMLRDTSDYKIPGEAELHYDDEDDHDEDEHSETMKLENSGVKTNNLTGGLSYIGNRGFFGVAVGGLNSKYGIPGTHGHHEDEDHEDEEHEGAHDEEEGGVTVDLNQIRYDFKAALDNPFSGIREIRTMWGYNDYEHDEIEPEGEIGTSFRNKELEGRIEAFHTPIGNPGWNGVFGLQITDREFSAEGEEAFVLPSEQDSIAVFLLEKADIDNWHINIGLRYEHLNSESISGDLTDHDLYSLYGGLSWDYMPGYELGISLGRTERAPTIEELYSNGPHLATNTFDIGNPDLKKESPHNIDIHWGKTEGRFTAGANLFYNQINNFIYQQAQDLNNDGLADQVEEDFSGDIAEILDVAEQDELLLLFHTQTDARLYGIELESTVNLFNDQRGMLDLRLWTDYVRGKLTDNGGNLPRISPWRLGANLDFERGPWSLNLDFTHTGKQTTTAELEEPTSGFEMLNVYAGYTFNLPTTSLTLFARGTNLLGQEIRRHTSFVKAIAPLPGRSGIIGIRATF